MQPQPAFEGGKAEFGLLGGSPQIQNVLRTIKKLANDTSPVLILGESGVGKELVARALHQVSPLCGKIFMPVDAATLVGSLAERELFGHVKGVFTGATESRAGLVQAADGGTLFLDEIGELAPEVQAKLLRLLQEEEIRPVGGTRPVKVRVRVLAATNRDLEAAVREGRFRVDLYHRLKVISIRIPPLRQRTGDVLPLARHFIAKYARWPVTISDDAVKRLLEHHWPGNVRELENAIRSALAMRSEPVIRAKDLPTGLNQHGILDETGLSPRAAEVSLPLAEVERRHILKVMAHTKNDIHTAAHLLGIGKSTLYRKLKKYRRAASEKGDPQGRLFEWPA